MTESMEQLTMTEEQIKQLQKENELMKEVLRKCLKARQINHVKQLIKELKEEMK